MQGGMGDYTRELARMLPAFGIEAHVITTTQAGRPAETARSSELCIVHPVVHRWNWHALQVIDGLLAEIQPAIVHLQYQTAAYGMHPAINFLPLWLRQRRPEIRTAITYHDLRVPYLFPKAGPVRWWVTLAPARWSHAVLVTNAEDWHQLSDKWTREEGEKGNKEIRNLLALVPIGSNIHPNPPADFVPDVWRARVGVGHDETMLVYFGFLNASKGGETLIRALGQLVEQSYRCRLVMLGGQVGASDPTNRIYLEQVKSLIDRLGLAERVAWTGFIPDEQVSAYLLAADVAVLPYRDGASFRRGSLMAALAHGLPIVTTRPRETRPAGNLPQLVDGVNTRLVPPGDPEALAQVVGELIDDPLQRRRLGLFARQLSRAFTWDKIAARHRAIYEQVLQAGC